MTEFPSSNQLNVLSFGSISIVYIHPDLSVEKFWHFMVAMEYTRELYFVGALSGCHWPSQPSLQDRYTYINTSSNLSLYSRRI